MIQVEVLELPTKVVSFLKYAKQFIQCTFVHFRKKKEEEIQEEDYYRSERSYGSFSRTVELPREVQTDKAKASFKDGVLEIRLPKTEEAKKKEISVKVD